jgi:hypothetical protein
VNKLASILATIESAASIGAQLDPAISTDVQLGEFVVTIIQGLLPHAQTAAAAVSGAAK